MIRPFFLALPLRQDRCGRLLLNRGLLGEYLELHTLVSSWKARRCSVQKCVTAM